jgi:hypothetical protein
MKSSLRSRQEPRRVSNGVIIGAMLLSLCVLSFVKARYCATPLGASRFVACVTFPLVPFLSVCQEKWRWWGLRGLR